MWSAICFDGRMIMNRTEIDYIVGDWVKEGIHIPQETVDYVLWYCERKMDVNKIEDREGYLPLLFKDELKNYLFRQSVNATTLLRIAERKVKGWNNAGKYTLQSMPS